MVPCEAAADVVMGVLQYPSDWYDRGGWIGNKVGIRA